jgi:hypothetical protein
MLETFGELTGEIDRINVSPAPTPDGDPVGIEAPLNALKDDLQTADILKPDAFDDVVEDVRAQHGTPQPEEGERQRTLIAYQLDPEGARRFDDAHIFREDHARLSAVERTFVQAVMDALAAHDELDDRLFDICVAEQSGAVRQPIESADDGLAGAVSKLSDYFAQNCPGDAVPDQMRKAFGRYTCQEAIDLHQARWGR